MFQLHFHFHKFYNDGTYHDAKADNFYLGLQVRVVLPLQDHMSGIFGAISSSTDISSTRFGRIVEMDAIKLAIL